MKKFKWIPPFLMLLSGAVVSIVMFIRGCGTTQMLLWLLGVMILFYMAGCIIQRQLTKFVTQIMEQEVQEEAQRLKEAEEEQEALHTQENEEEA